VLAAQVARDKVGRVPALRRFVQHAVEMLLAMVAGMMLLGPVWDMLWPGRSDRVAADTLVMAVNMAVGMAAWMWLRGHGGRLVAEMSVAMVGPFGVLLIPYWLGLISGSGLTALGHIGMVVAMVGAMVLRLDAYTHAHRWRLPGRGRRVGEANYPVAVGSRCP
jgi:flagellar biosynthetic protein FliP